MANSKAQTHKVVQRFAFEISPSFKIQTYWNIVEKGKF